MPFVSLDAVVNGASAESGSLAPGQLVSIFGTQLGPGAPVQSRSLERGLAGSRVFFGGTEAFLTYTSNTQINALVPFGVAGREQVEAQVEYLGVRSATVSIQISESSPAIFTADGSGQGPAVAITAEGTLSSETNPAPRGSIVTFWATGQGQTTPGVSDGQLPASPYPKARAPLSVLIGGVAAEVLFSGLVYPGVMQFNVRVPNAVEVGMAELLLKIGASESRKGVTIAVR
jgi:uncharacterized protein (TIGR03437 family)